MSKSPWQMADGKHRMNGELENNLEDLWFLFGSLVEYHPNSAKDQSRLHQFGKIVLLGIFLGYALHAGWNLERRYFGRKHWGAGKFGRVRNSCPKAQCEGSDNAEKWWKLRILNAEGTVELSGRDHGIRKSISRWDQLVRSQDISGHLEGSSDNSQPKDEITDDQHARDDFWSIEGNYIYHHHIEPRVQLYVPKEETFPVPLRYIDVTRTTHTTLDPYRRLLEHWCESKFIAVMDWIHAVHSSQSRMKNLLTEICGPECGSQKFKQLPDLIICGHEIWSSMSRAAQRKEKQQWAIEKPKLDNARTLSGIYFIDPYDREFKETFFQQKR